nr:hypothetical protein [Lysinibacillus timonensis]
MTFASFNPIQLQQSNIVQNQPLTLKQGQVLHGTIKKLYPDQIAEIQVGNQKFVAKLETPLKAGDSHFFQVTSISPQAELKVVTGPMTASNSMMQQIHQLLESMNIPKSKEMTQIVSYFLKEQLPISKELLLQAQSLLNGNDGQSKQEAIQALQKMVELKFPFTKEVFQAIVNGSKTGGMNQTIENFAQALVKDTFIQEQTKTSIMQQLDKITKPLDVEKGGLILGRIVQSLMNESEPLANKLQNLDLLKEASLLSKQANVSNWMQVAMNQTAVKLNNQPIQNAGQLIQLLQTMQPDNVTKVLEQVTSWVQQQAHLSASQKSEVLSLIQRFETMPRQPQVFEQFTKQMNELLLKSLSSSITNELLSNDSNGATAKQQLLSLFNSTFSYGATLLSQITKVANESSQPQMVNLVQQVDHQINSSIDGHTIEHAMKSILKSLGISYESALNQNNQTNQTIEQLSNQLKPQLLSLLQDVDASVSVKDAAELLLARMNGMQLLSGENGHQHQIVMQIPLNLFGKPSDATLQWSGRMKEDGKIDGSYARVLFYLDMGSIKETVVDMQVQNRVITINLYNHLENLQDLAEPLLHILKDKLSEKDYYLSGVFFKPYEKNNAPNNVKKRQMEPSQSSGVDIRI